MYIYYSYSIHWLYRYLQLSSGERRGNASITCHLLLLQINFQFVGEYYYSILDLVSFLVGANQPNDIFLVHGTTTTGKVGQFVFV